MIKQTMYRVANFIRNDEDYLDEILLKYSNIKYKDLNLDLIVMDDEENNEGFLFMFSIGEVTILDKFIDVSSLIGCGLDPYIEDIQNKLDEYSNKIRVLEIKKQIVELNMELKELTKKDIK